MINGRIYAAATMAELGNHPREPNELWWEIDAAARPAGALAVPPAAHDIETALGVHATCRH